MNDIFVDILPQPGESAEDFGQRHGEMERATRHLHGDGVEAVVVPVARG